MPKNSQSRRMPCAWCGGAKPPGTGKKNCGQCKPVDLVWDHLEMGPGDCWLWTGKTFKGYGILLNQYLVHRLVYEELIVEIPGLDIDHLCVVTLCANPWHLDPVTASENSRRKWQRYTHCKVGHEFTPENTYRYADGRRSCRACNRVQAAEYRRRGNAVA